MKKKALSLALALAMCLGLNVPAFAAAPLDQATGKDMLKTFTLMRNGTVDETAGAFVDKSATYYSIVIGDPEVYGEPTKIEYAVFDEEDSWTITNTGNKDYTLSGNTDYEICIYMRELRMDIDLSMDTPDSVFSCGDYVNDYWTDKGTFLYGALEGNDEIGNIISLKAGESTTIPAKAFVSEYGNLLDGYGPIYEMEIATFYNGTVTEENGFEDARYTTFYFRVNNGKTKEIKDSLNKPVVLPENATAAPTNDKLEVNGTAADPTVYKINGSNYFKIRDVAALLNGTEKQFAVGYDGGKNAVTATTGQGYAKQAGDLAGAPSGGSQSAEASNDAIYVNGEKITAEVYKIGGSNYFKLRDLGKALNFYVGWSADRGMYIETEKSYSE